MVCQLKHAVQINADTNAIYVIYAICAICAIYVVYVIHAIYAVHVVCAIFAIYDIYVIDAIDVILYDIDNPLTEFDLRGNVFYVFSICCSYRCCLLM